MKRFLLFLLPIIIMASLQAEMLVTNVNAKPHSPWDGKIDITYFLEGGKNDEKTFVEFHGSDNGQTEVAAKTLSGDGIDEALSNGGPYAATWDFAADCPDNIPTDMGVKARAISGTYLVVNLKSGTHRYTDTTPDLSDDTCRTTELWLRRIPAGTFMMGSPEGEIGRSGDEPQHAVTLTEDYYIGIFEVTQKQYDLLMTDNMSECKGDCRPVDNISYDIIRGTKKKAGADWPLHGHVVDEDSFFGKLRAKTGLVFDIPTEAQWEYACRAGSTTALSTGRNLMAPDHDSSMNEAGRYGGNRSDGRGGYGEHTKVGSYLPNAWGLYDMHGNVGEWCLDRYGPYDFSAQNDPVGALTGNGRVIRGGTWNAFYVYASNCRSAARGQDSPERPLNIWGFRVVYLPSVSLTKHKLSVNGEETQYLEGDIVTTNAPIQSGYYIFKEWIAEGVVLSDTKSLFTSFRMPANDVKLTASYDFPLILKKKSYIVVNLIDGSVRYSNAAPNIFDDTCRTTELWLRRIPAGTFLMGSPEDEIGRQENEKQHKVTISNDYYIGVFETTQMQWKLVMGTDPSYRKGDCRPVETVAYDSVADVFMRKISEKTHLCFSLPSEAQWEYACRAGTATSLNSNMNLTGTGVDPELSEIARYLLNNRDGKGDYDITTKVGMYQPNAWELYDMHGNVAEWCRDWYAEYPDTNEAIDPEGPQHGTIHVRRGGCAEDTALKCRSAFRAVDGDPPGGDGGRGFRVMVQPSPPSHSVVVNGKKKKEFFENEELTITAEIPEGSTFSEWIPEGIVLNARQRYANPVAFKMPANDVTLTAKYEPAHHIAVKDVHASRSLSGNDLVDIVYSVDCDVVDDQGNPAEIFMDFSLVNNETKETFKLTSLTGDGADSPITAGGPYAVVWDKRRDLPGISGDSFSIVVSARAMLPKQPIPGDPVVYLPLSDSTASAAETGQPLSYYGKPTSTVVEGIPCTYFDGKSAIYNSECRFTPAMASCTISAWIRTPSNVSHDPVCELGIWEGWNSAYIDIFTPVIRPGKVCVYTKHSDNTDGDLSYEQWHHVLVWGSRLSAVVYVDGAYAASNEVGCDNFPKTEARMEPIQTSFVIGSNRNRGKAYGRDGFWRGHIASFRVYDRILNQSEIKALACEFRPDELLAKSMSTPLELKASARLQPIDGMEVQGKNRSEIEITPPVKEGHVSPKSLPGGTDWDNRNISATSFSTPADDVTPTASYTEIGAVDSPYLVVNLETGLKHFADKPPTFSDDAYYTTELWLRRIPAGDFFMGSPEYETGHEGDETQHYVTLKSDYYIGVFEVTQKQYELIFGDNPSNYKGDRRPVECVSYIDIRGAGKTAGAGWPTYGHAVDADSFLGKLRAKTGLLFDLPTEAQWEYACRATRPTASDEGSYFDSAEEDYAMNDTGRFWGNKSDRKNYPEHAGVGSYRPNAWELYDMHGNVFEWCLDWYGEYPSADVTDPIGAQTGEWRVLRGGSWSSFDAMFCRSANRSYSSPSSSNSCTGFRVICLPLVPSD